MTILMGIGLAACAGIRAWLPLWILGLLGRFHYITLHQDFQFLQRTDVLIILTLATIVEILGDKIVVIDHLLDGIGTVLRPAAGTVLVSSLFSDMPLSTAVLIGLMAGVPITLGTHLLKSTLRSSITMLAPFHGGIGNTTASFIEDFSTFSGILLAVTLPILAGSLTLLFFYLGLRIIRRRKQRTNSIPMSYPETPGSCL